MKLNSDTIKRILVLGIAVDRLSVDLEHRGLLILDHLFLFFFLFFIIRSVISGLLIAKEAQGDAENVEKPKQVERLQRGEQGSCNVLAQCAFVLLSLPVELKRTNSAELSEEGPEDLDVDNMAHIDPDTNKESKVRSNNWVINVVENFGGGEEEVTDVMSDVDSDANVGEMETIAEANEGQADNVMSNELLEVLSRLFHTKDQDNGLLSPVSSLEEVIKLDDALVGTVREVLVHAASVEIPDGSAAHDVHASRPENTKVNGRVQLLHKPCLLALAKTSGASKRPEHLLHNELTCKREDNSVKSNKGNIPAALAIVQGFCWIVPRKRIRQEDEAVERIGLGRVDSVADEENEEQNSW